MDAPAENMVLRTVYLPKSLDLQLRDLAFKYELSKGEFIRLLIAESLDRRTADGDLPLGEASTPAAPARLLEVADIAKANPAKVAARTRKPARAKKVVKAKSPQPKLAPKAAAEKATPARGTKSRTRERQPELAAAGA